MNQNTGKSAGWGNFHAPRVSRKTFSERTESRWCSKGWKTCWCVSI